MLGLTLKESFNNVKLICSEALLNEKQRNAINESLDNIVKALHAYEQPQLEDTSDGNTPDEDAS